MSSAGLRAARQRLMKQEHEKIDLSPTEVDSHDDHNTTTQEPSASQAQEIKEASDTRTEAHDPSIPVAKGKVTPRKTYLEAMTERQERGKQALKEKLERKARAATLKKEHLKDIAALYNDLDHMVSAYLSVISLFICNRSTDFRTYSCKQKQLHAAQA